MNALLPDFGPRLVVHRPYERPFTHFGPHFVLHLQRHQMLFMMRYFAISFRDVGIGIVVEPVGLLKEDRLMQCGSKRGSTATMYYAREARGTFRWKASALKRKSYQRCL